MSSLQARPRFQHELIHCPGKNEENRPVGILAIWAYLHVTGDVLVYQSRPGGGFKFVSQAIDEKILPQKIEIHFSVDFADSPFSNHEVDKAQAPVGTSPGASPVSYPENVSGVNLERNYLSPRVPYSDEDDTGLCLKGTAHFSWESAVLQIAGGAGGTASVPLPVVSPIGTTGGGSFSAGVGGQTFPLDVGWQICYGDGCAVTIVPSPDTATDAKAVYSAANGGNP